MITVRLALGIAVMAATLAACGDDQPATSDQRLVYVEQSAGGNLGGRIVSVNADGEQRQVLWEQPSGQADVLQAFVYPSPSGATVLFVDIGQQSWFTLPAAGGTATPFAKPVDAGSPHWAPDESVIAWLVGGSSPTIRIGTAAPGSTTLTLLTPDTILAQQFQWSPDGSQIAFEGRLDAAGEDHIFTIARTGGDVHPLSTAPENHDVTPAWSPSGEWIAFVREAGTDRGIWAAHPDGSQARSVSPGVFDRYSGLYWSPDGTRLAAALNGPGNLTVIDFATGAQTQLHLASSGGNPWSPDGKRITYLGRTPPDVNNNTGPAVGVSTPNGANPVHVSPDSVYGSGQSWLAPAR